ncbi:hypothetical protein B9T25_07530 [Acinetobacter sp. ANC 4470]|uniref:hypothetical protein n=1 Tax=Acinetobacter sp. ANC 4470 TaxID=1977881 RepID=UPI000A3459B9|nr:hypothetical protein [Acinetobacter sp. ANC 4470]OTG67824.1 hypothetical protein B9T25_07530 [Acinetobacter sp. ANC 4470]
MHTRPVKAYKMNEDFKVLPKIMYMGEYDDDDNLINVYDASKEKLTKIMGTYQWILDSTGEIFFIEDDFSYLKN